MKLLSIKLLNDILLTPQAHGLMKLGADFRCDFITDDGVYRLKLRKGWITDLRSGSDIINGMVPKWGSPQYTACVLAHDASFSGWLSFDLANELFLEQGMPLSGDISSKMGVMACEAVNHFGRGHYYEMDDIMPEPYATNKTLESLTLEAK
jgi:hypothetical protein